VQSAPKYCKKRKTGPTGPFGRGVGPRNWFGPPCCKSDRKARAKSLVFSVSQCLRILYVNASFLGQSQWAGEQMEERREEQIPKTWEAVIRLITRADYLTAIYIIRPSFCPSQSSITALGSSFTRILSLHTECRVDNYEEANRSIDAFLSL
jgi:hypothetical protein